MFEIGNSLRQARQHQTWEISDVERQTRIRAKYLTALEEERFDVLPGVAYVRGFLRTYAEFLGLDGSLLVDEYNAQFAPPEDELPPIQPDTLAGVGHRLAHPALAGALVALTFAVVAVWQLGFSSARRTAIPQARAAAPLVRHAQPAVKPAATRKRTVVAPPRTLVVRTSRGDCWVSVRTGSPTGRVVFEGIVAKGRIVRFGLRQPLVVRLGAPWNADVTLRGKRLPAFGRQVVSLRAG